MLAKLTSKNQLTLPKAAIDAVGVSEYFDVTVREGQIVLTPVRIQRADAVRAKLAAMGVGARDITDAVRWARSSQSMVAELGVEYSASRMRSKAGKKPPPRA